MAAMTIREMRRISFHLCHEEVLQELLKNLRNIAGLIRNGISCISNRFHTSKHRCVPILRRFSVAVVLQRAYQKISCGLS